MRRLLIYVLTRALQYSTDDIRKKRVHRSKPLQGIEEELASLFASRGQDNSDVER